MVFPKIFRREIFIEENTTSPDPHLILFSRKHQLLIGLLLFIFLIGLSFRIHGYSLSQWHEYIDNSPKKEILIGKSRSIRSDDWAVEIPLMLAQLHHEDNPYPLYNENIGYKANMLVHSKVAIVHPVSLFRPTVWGFFLNEDVGLAWMWWSMVLGLFYTYFLVIMLITRNHFDLSVLGSLLIVFSPFFQFWSMHMAEIPVFMGLIFISFAYLCFSRNKRTIWIQGPFLGWVMGCYALNFVYPPYQVSCAYLLAFMMLGLLIERKADFSILRAQWPERAGAAIICLVVFAGALLIYFSTINPVIDLVLNTLYPGQRFSVGGDFQFWLLLRTNFLLPVYGLFSLDWSKTVFGNICESSSFFFIAIPIGLALMVHIVVHKRFTERFALMILGYIIFMSVYLFIGYTPWISKITLFSMMHTHRAVIGIGIANVLLITAYAADPAELGKIAKGIISCLWFLILMASGIELTDYFQSQILYRYIFVISLANAALCFYLLGNQKRRKKVIAILVLVSVISTGWFNPVVVGGTDFIYQNPLSRKIIEIDRTGNGNTLWLTYGSWVLANLPRMLGADSVNGTHMYPQFEVWKGFDKDDQFQNVFNRFAHITFKAADSSGSNGMKKPVQFYSPVPDQFVVVTDPTPSVLGELGVTHLLVQGEHSGFDRNPALKKVYSYKDKQIYEVLTR